MYVRIYIYIYAESNETDWLKIRNLCRGFAFQKEACLSRQIVPKRVRELSKDE